MNAKFYTLAILCLLATLSLQGQENILDLRQCLEIGLKQNYDIRIIRNEQQISDNNYTVGNAGYLPVADLLAGFSGTNNNTKQYPADGSGVIENNGVNNTTANAGVNLNWTIFDGLKIQAQYSRLKELKQMGELNTRLTIEDFIAGLSAEYFNYVRQNLRLNNLKYAVGLSRERLRIVEARYNMGSMSRLDLQQAKVDFNADSSKLIKHYEVLHTSRIRLNEMMALDEINHPLLVKDTAIYSDMFLMEKDLSQKMLQSNSSLLLSEKNKNLSNLDYKIVKSRNYPYLKLNAGYGYTDYRYGSGTYDRQQVAGLNYGITLGFNLFDGLNRKREQKNARLQIENRELQYEQLSLGLKADLSNIYMAYQNNLELLDLEKQNLVAARQNHEIAIERYKLGELSGIELREAQNSLLEAEERLLEAEYNTKLCEISLMQISGQVTNYLE